MRRVLELGDHILLVSCTHVGLTERGLVIREVTQSMAVLLRTFLWTNIVVLVGIVDDIKQFCIVHAS